MQLFPTHRQVRRARTRTVLLFFKAIAIVTATIIGLVTVHRLLGWW